MPANETRYDADTVLWTAGVEAPPVAEALAAATGAKRDKAGRIVVEKNLTIPGHPEISVLGDMMSLDKLPGVAEVAMQSGLYAGTPHPAPQRRETSPRSRSATATSARRPTSPAAVPSSQPARCRSAASLGWWIWLFIHIAFLTGYRNRVGAVLTWWLAFTRDIRRERTFTTQQIETLRDVYARPAVTAAPQPAPDGSVAMTGADSRGSPPAC